MNIEIGNGKTIYISAYEWLFMIKEDEVDDFYRSCIADEAGIYIDDPFSNKSAKGKIEVDNTPEIPDENTTTIENYGEDFDDDI